MTATPARPGPLASAQMVSRWVMEFDAPWLGFLSLACVILVAIGDQMTDAPVEQRAGEGNRLGRETSPYLLQHKDNPVHWWAWGPEALAEAKRTGKPILLSVGYAACHWCHVMAHESFEDDETAALMNELFVNIKVDREERPDIDAIYMRRCTSSASRAAGRSPCSSPPMPSRSGAAPISPRTRATAGRAFRMC